MSVVYNLANYMGFCPPNVEIKKKEPINRTSEQQAIVIADYIHRCQVLDKKEPPPDRISETVSCVVDEFLKGNSDTFSAITELLDDMEVKGKTHEQIIENVLNAMFAEEKFNWGRVVGTYAFGVKYCQMYLNDENGNKQDSSSGEVMHFIGEYVGQKLGHWIKTQGGWEAVLCLFPNKRVIMKQLRSAGFLVLTVGVGSLLNVLSS